MNRGAHRVVDIKGERYGGLVALKPTGDSDPRRGRLWLFMCDCGTPVTAPAGRVRIGHIQSCGCYTRGEHKARAMRSHGMSDSPAYRIWSGMISRCTYPKHRGFYRYGGRGITVCERWRSFENFYADMGDRPAGKSLDRINVNGNYEPSNCRWATKREQSRNTSKTKMYTYNGKTMCISDWIAEIKGE